MYRHYYHYNDCSLKLQVPKAGGGLVKWLILSYLVYDKTFRSPVRRTYSIVESDHNTMNKINKYHDFMQYFFSILFLKRLDLYI